MVGSPAEPHSVAGIVVGLRRSQWHATACAWEFTIGSGWSGVILSQVALGRSPKEKIPTKTNGRVSISSGSSTIGIGIIFLC